MTILTTAIPSNTNIASDKVSGMLLPKYHLERKYVVIDNTIAMASLKTNIFTTSFPSRLKNGKLAMKGTAQIPSAVRIK